MISPSSLNLFFQCPYRWYLTKQGIEGIWVDDKYARFGSMIHNIIATYFNRLPDKVTEKTIEELALKCLDEGFDDSIGFRRKTAEKIINNFIEFEKYRLNNWSVYKPTFIEQRLRLSDQLVGIVDFYGNNTIIDWKTGQYVFMTTELKRQGAVYKYLLQKAGYKVDKVLFVFLRENKVLELPYVTDGWIENEVRRMLNMIQGGIFPKRRTNMCNWCEYKLRCQIEDKKVCLWMI